MKACSKCGAVKPLTEFRRQKGRSDGRASECKPCKAKLDRAWYEANRERRSAYHKEWYAKNREVMIENSRRWYRDNPLLARARRRAYYRENPDEKRAATREWYRANKERSVAYGRMYRERNRERVNETHRQWREKNIERVRTTARLASQRRRARKFGVTSDFTAEQWLELVESYDHRCAYCGGRFEKLTQDHVVPLALGGGHTLSNIVPACSRCNKRKWIKTDWVPIVVPAA